METMESSSRLVRLGRLGTYLVPCYYSLLALFILCMAIDAHEHDNALLIRSPRSSPRPLFESLYSAGYTRMAALLAHPHASGFDLATFRNLTIFAPPDRVLSPMLHPHALSHLIHFHASAQKLSHNDLLSMRSGDRISSLEPGRDIVIGRSGGREIITLNGRARLVFPDVYSDSNVVVHGIDRVVDVDHHLKRRRKTIKKASKKSRISGSASRSVSGARNHILPHSPSVSSRVLDRLRRPWDSNAGPGGSEGHSTLSPRPDGHMQARRSEVPRSIPRSGVKDLAMSSDLWSPSSSEMLLYPSPWLPSE